MLKRYVRALMTPRAEAKLRREIDIMRALRGHPGVTQALGDYGDARHHVISMVRRRRR